MKTRVFIWNLKLYNVKKNTYNQETFKLLIRIKEPKYILLKNIILLITKIEWVTFCFLSTPQHRLALLGRYKILRMQVELARALSDCAMVSEHVSDYGLVFS